MKKILSIIVLAVIIFCVSGCEKKKEPFPKITEGEFPFVLEYEIGGQRYLIEDTVVCKFSGHDLSNPFPFLDYSRTWDSKLKSGNEDKRVLIEFDANTESQFVKDRINIDSRAILYYGSGGYYLGDPDEAERGPCIRYVERYRISENGSSVESVKLSFNQLDKFFGIKIIRFEFSEPIKNIFK